MTKSIQRILIVLLMLIPCLFVFSGCGNTPNQNTSITYSEAFNKTGIPNLNAGTIKNYVNYNDGSTRVVMSGLNNVQIEDYKRKLTEKNGFVLVSEEDGVDGKWARKNSIDGHDGDKIILTTTEATSGYFDLDIYYESYFAMQEEHSTPATTALANLIDNIQQSGSVYFSMVVNDTSSLETYDNLESLSLQKEVVLHRDGNWAYQYTYTIKVKNDPQVKFASLKIAYDNTKPYGNEQVTYTYNFNSTNYYDQGSLFDYGSLKSYIDLPESLNGILQKIVYDVSLSILELNIGKGKYVHRSDVCDIEYYNIRISETVTKQNLPYIFKNQRLVACNIDDVLTNISLTATYSDALLSADTTNLDKNNASNFIPYFFEKSFLAELFTTTETE